MLGQTNTLQGWHMSHTGLPEIIGVRRLRLYTGKLSKRNAQVSGSSPTFPHRYAGK